MPRTRTLALLVLSAVLIALTSGPLRAEEGTVKAMSAWVGQGQFFKVGTQEALFVGGFRGIMFVENQQGALDAAKIICPGTVDINLDTGSQAGEGRCIITARDGNRVFARWRCEGVHLVGCLGKFDLTAGTGRFEGITGTGDFVVRSAIQEIAVEIPSGSIHESAVGLAVWPALQYRIP